MIITLFDYGAGNLHSLAKALAAPSVELVVETDPVRALDSDLLVLPGVGAFGAAADRLAPGRDAMREAIRGGLPVIGICLGCAAGAVQGLFFHREDWLGGYHSWPRRIIVRSSAASFCG